MLIEFLKMFSLIFAPLMKKIISHRRSLLTILCQLLITRSFRRTKNLPTFPLFNYLVELLISVYKSNSVYSIIFNLSFLSNNLVPHLVISRPCIKRHLTNNKKEFVLRSRQLIRSVIRYNTF